MNETDLFQQELLNSLTGDTKLGRLFAQDSGDFPFAVGLAESFKAAAVAALLMKKQQSVLLLTPDAESAARWQENLCALLPKDMSERVLLLPPVELSPFTDFQPEADVVAARLNALAALSKEETVCVVTPAEALLGRFQPKDAFAAERLLLTPGVTIELDELAQRLIELGYQRESMIDTPGTFACRGGIADIYPSAGIARYGWIFLIMKLKLCAISRRTRSAPPKPALGSWSFSPAVCKTPGSLCWIICRREHICWWTRQRSVSKTCVRPSRSARFILTACWTRTA